MKDVCQQLRSDTMHNATGYDNVCQAVFPCVDDLYNKDEVGSLPDVPSFILEYINLYRKARKGN